MSAELGRYRLSSLSGCCPKRMLQCAQKVNQNMWSCENLRLAPVSAAIGVFLSPRLLRARRLVLHSSILETCYRESLRNDPPVSGASPGLQVGKPRR
jgi:hypothetical protein